MQPTAPIAPLPPEEIEKICAGEVVERPLSVVKELIENALDGQATEIAITLEDGGRELIRVSDDGAGIPFSELPLALRRHHTSKIRCLDDLFALSTLGFRGEALSSIAAVSQLTLVSRSAMDELGGRIEASGGALTSHARSQLSRGTEVEVRELFFNTPARKKFLRSRQAEQSQIAALVSTYALAYPEVRFSLSAGGRTLIATDGVGGTRSVLGGLLGAEAAAALAEIDYEFPPLAVGGLITEPEHHRHNRARQWYFVNRRPVANKLLFQAVDDSVREYLSPGKHPQGAFFLELPPEEVDVNVHPMKAEVNFAEPQAVYSLLATGIRRALGAAAQRRRHRLTRGLAAIVTPAMEGAAAALSQSENAGVPGTSASEAFLGEPPADESPTPPGHVAIPVYDMGHPFAPPGTPKQDEPPPAPVEIPFPVRGELAELLAAQVPAAAVEPAPERRAAPAVAPSAPGTAPLQEGAQASLPATTLPAPIAQIAATYLVFATPDELYIVDQHAAHERLLFEDLTATVAKQARSVRQRLLFPLIVPLTPAEAELARQLTPALTRLGFACRLGAGSSLVVSEVPALLARYVAPELLPAVLDELSGLALAPSLDAQVKQLAASLACHSAIRAGQALSGTERAELFRLIAARLSSLVCPHGRPVVLMLGAEELARLFLR